MDKKYLESYIRSFIPKIKDHEIEFFVNKLNALNLDPYASQAKLFIKDNEPIIAVTLEGYRRLAIESLRLLGFERPIIAPSFKDGNLNSYLFRINNEPVMVTAPQWTVCNLQIRDFPSEAMWIKGKPIYFKEFVPSMTNPVWAKMPNYRLKQVAESISLRSLISVSGVYTLEELEIIEERSPKDNRKIDDAFEAVVKALTDMIDKGKIEEVKRKLDTIELKGSLPTHKILYVRNYLDERTNTKNS